MKKLFLICSLFIFSHLFSADDLLVQQQLAKYQIGVGVSTNNWIPYVYGVNQLSATDVGTPLTNYILGSVTAPAGVVSTTGMVNLPTYPLASKFTLLVNPAVYNSFPATENILIKDTNLFDTIQAAVNYAVNYANNGTLNRWTILVAPGTYLENLNIGGVNFATADKAMSITLAALGKVTLGNGAGTGSVIWSLTRNSIQSGARYPSLMFTAYRTDSTDYNARWIITMGFNFNRMNLGNPSGALSTVLLQLHYVTINGPVDFSYVDLLPGAGGCMCDFLECVFNQTVFISPTTSTFGYLMAAQGCVFNQLVTSYYYHKILGCVFQNGMTCNDVYAGTGEGIYGIYRSKLTGTFNSNAVAKKIYIDHFTDTASPTATYLPAGNKQIMQ
jgi:hypothetical protein